MRPTNPAGAAKSAKPGRAPKQPPLRRRGPGDVPVLAYLASRYLKYGSLERARTLYAMLVILEPGDLGYRAALGIACLRSGRAEEALAHLEAAFKGRAPLSGWETMLMARALRANGMDRESRALIGGFLAEGEGR